MAGAPRTPREGCGRPPAEAVRLLEGRPLAGRQQPELIGPHYPLWSLSSFPYVLVYDPCPVPAQILRFLHASRDLPPLLADLRDPPGN